MKFKITHKNKDLQKYGSSSSMFVLALLFRLYVINKFRHDTHYRDCESLFSWIPPDVGMCALYLLMMASFHLLSNSLFTVFQCFTAIQSELMTSDKLQTQVHVPLPTTQTDNKLYCQRRTSSFNGFPVAVKWDTVRV